MSPRRREFCSVPGCANSTEKVRLFSLPSNDSIRFQWLDRIKNPLLTYVSRGSIIHFGICEIHFETSQFQTVERKKLNRGAVPTLHLPTSGIQAVQIAVPSGSDRNILAVESPPVHLLPAETLSAAQTSSGNLKIVII